MIGSGTTDLGMNGLETIGLGTNERESTGQETEMGTATGTGTEIDAIKTEIASENESEKGQGIGGTEEIGVCPLVEIVTETVIETDGTDREAGVEAEVVNSGLGVYES